jgi:FHA domain-containing protein
MNIVEKTRQLEIRIASKMTETARTLAQSRRRAREPIELAHAIVDAVAGEIQSGGRGTRVFPFNTIDVSILAPSDHTRARLEAILDGNVLLRDRITERLRAAACDATEVAVHINYVERAQEHWADPQFSIAFSRIAREPRDVEVPEAAPGRMEITVIRGAAEWRTYVFTSHRIDLGRGADVRDSGNGLIRTNHVAFSDESDDLSRSISRQHAHVVYEDGTGQFRLHDDGSVHGTKIVRKGKTLSVPWGGRGGLLQSGDEIALGEARVRVTFEPVVRRQGRQQA